MKLDQVKKDGALVALETAEFELNRVWSVLYQSDPNLSLETPAGKAEDILRRIRALKISVRNFGE